MANLIGNGSFVGHAGWWYTDEGYPVAFAASPSRSVGSGSATVTVAAGGSGTFHYRPGGAPNVSLGADATLDFVLYAQTADSAATGRWVITFWGDPYGADFLADGLGALTPIGATWTAIELRGASVPVGATHVTATVALNPTDGAPISVDDVYVGTAGGDAPPYPAGIAPTPQNRLQNGTFEVNAGDWTVDGTVGGAVRDTVNPIAGTGMLKVDATGQNGALSPLMGAVVVPGEALRLAFTVRGSEELEAVLNYTGPNGSTATLWTDTPTGDEAVVVTTVVPAGVSAAYLNIRTTGNQSTPFWLDRVSLGPPPAPPAPSLALAMLLDL